MNIKDFQNQDEVGTSKVMVKDRYSVLALNFRCPTCTKLYEVDSRLVKSSMPHFDCLVCGEVFTFSFPPKNWSKIETQKLENRNSASQKLDKACPKCSALNSSASQECYSCQVVFRSYELLKREDYPNALPSAVQSWQHYVQEYENREKQKQFLNLCYGTNQLDYAKAKLQSLREVMGEQDPYCTEAVAILDEMFQKKVRQKQVQKNEVQDLKQFREVLLTKFLQFLNQRRVLYCGPVLLSLLLIGIGLSFGHRNTVGPGVAILILHMGLIYTFKGRIALDDFLRK